MDRSSLGPLTGQALRSQLERLSDRSVPGLERGFGYGWVARRSLGVTGRANTAVLDPNATSDCPSEAGNHARPADVLDWVERWYWCRGARPGVQLFDQPDGLMTAALTRREWVQKPGAILMTCGMDQLLESSGSKEMNLRHLDSLEHTTDVAVSGLAAMVGDPGRLTEITSSSLPQSVITVRREGEPIGCGLGMLDGRWFGIFAMRTAAHARRTGIANRILAELANVGRDGGASTAWLQVEASNAGARALYERLGFQVAHAYTYWFSPVNGVKIDGGS